MRIKKAIIIICCLLQLVGVRAVESDFKVKGFHLDLRSQVMTMSALKAFAYKLSGMGVNTLVMEWEATFPYEQHATITNKYGYAPTEIKEFIAYCSNLNIDVIPIHHCFGHVEWILRHDRYRHISEDKKEVSQVCPLKEEDAVKIFSGLFKELMDYHPSPYFHIGGDETYLLGSCAECSKKAEEQGKSKLFVDYMKAMCKIVSDNGKIPVLWADIILKYPEAINEMPKNAIYVDWNYGWKINHYFGDIEKLKEAGATLWGAPSIRSSPDNMHLTSWITHFNNQRDFIPYSRQAGYEGIIMTSWSTSGLYSFLYDQSWEIQDMEQVRNVYPLNGFDILLEAYARSLSQTNPLDPEAFVLEYAEERMGLSAEQAKILWSVFCTPQAMVRREEIKNPTRIESMYQQAVEAKNKLYGLQPKRNKIELEHWKLMADIRVNYLAFKKIEAIYQSDDYRPAMSTSLLKSLNDLLKTEKQLDKRFASLQKGFLSEREIKHQNEIRKRKLLVIRDVMENQSKAF